MPKKVCRARSRGKMEKLPPPAVSTSITLPPLAAGVHFGQGERAAGVVYPEVEDHRVFRLGKAQRPHGVDVEVVDGAVDALRQRPA